LRIDVRLFYSYAVIPGFLHENQISFVFGVEEHMCGMVAPSHVEAYD
jgi:hypothetical protein